ncbi:MAG: hypothetical protein IKE34_00060 [Paenibacillus sp.]|uniref:Copper amine oxidase N-terminal domain-containing protein n=1 Tax=Paenibacillus aquistagni TaxID=1852522 RepID=A0A1X7LH39_9BACL|nr:hypothetical protein [Paenibacillus aquistagni]MBR2567570.1 hypothetical protein [Paenibacillus sp.]SMG53188.1 hypothetical protein SAMN06295960_3455 [Paenibacillus aquistagni]
MKKWIIVGLCAAVLGGGTAVWASGSSLVGKKVERIVSLYVGDTKVNTDAIIIDGVTYAPVRKVGEITGLQVNYESGTVKLNRKNAGDNSSNTSNLTRIEEINARLQANKEKMKSNSQSIGESEKKLGELRAKYGSDQTGLQSDKDYKYHLAFVKAAKAENADIEKENESLNKEKQQLLAMNK